MGLFSGMGKFGLDQYKDMNIIEKKKPIDIIDSMSSNEPQKSPEVMEEETLYNKTYKCPVCDLTFMAKCVKAGKVKLVDKDTDLRPIYKFMDPIKYDVVTCDKCGYSAIIRYFGKLSTRQMREINDHIGKNFTGIDNSMARYSYDDAIMRYKLALLSSVVKKAKNSEKAYTCLKLGWVIRGKRLSLGVNAPGVKELYVDELDALKNAYEGFVIAISDEPFPIAGMDENTLTYIMSDLARRLKRFDEAIKLLGGVITSKTVSPRLKDEALKLKDLIKGDLKKNA